MVESKKISDNQSLFKGDYKLINLKYEYENFIEPEQWAIATDLSKKELYEKYPEIIRQHAPFVLLTKMQYKVIHEFNVNEDKFRKRRNNNEDIFGYDDEATEKFHSEAIEPDFIYSKENEEYEEKRYLNKIMLLDKAKNSLTEKQHKYLVEKYKNGKSAREIAKCEGISHQVVDRQLKAAIKKYQKFFKDYYT